MNELNYLLIPHYLSSIKKKFHVGFYFHSPFPEFVHFNKMPYGTDIYYSILNCDFIAFNFYQQATNFFQVCQCMGNLQMMCEKNGYLLFNYKGRRIHIRIINMGIEKVSVKKKMLSLKFNKFKQAIRKKLAGRTQLLTIEESTYTSVILKLKAFKLLLKKDLGELKSKIYYLIIINESDFDPYQITKIKLKVQKIADRFGENIIELRFKKIKRTEKYAIMACSDVFYVLSLRDKIN